MSMLKCHECGSGVSSEAKSCPSCGAKVKAPTKKLTWVFAIVLGVVFVQWIASEAGKTPVPVVQKTPEQIAKEEAGIAENQEIQAKLRALKQATKNPASFEIDQAIYTDDKVLCVIYRGTNSYGAIVPEGKAITVKGAIGDFNRLCKDKAGRSVRSLGP